MLTREQLVEFRQHLQDISDSISFPREDELQCFLDKAVAIQESEDESYRPLNSAGKSGGLLDFTKSQLPVIIVPDIHGRADFLLKLIDFKVENSKTVLELLNENQIMVICVGDAVHSEMRGYERWLESFRDWNLDVYAGPTMQEEMKENFSVWLILMELKKTFVPSFHFLKGNHENVTNEDAHGNHSFRKFVCEGQMCCDFIRQVYGDVILHLINLWEKSLPLCAVFSSFGISHAEPAKLYKKKEVINSFENDSVVEGLTWTRNDEAEENSCRKLFRELSRKRKSKGILWFGGHRPVKDCMYKLRQNDSYIQIHNPDKTNVAFVVPEKEFDPAKDIWNL